jgi:hypothetical protein
MSGKIKNINSFSRFLDYLSQKLKGKERNTFEKELERDPFEKEAMEGLSQLNSEEFSADMIELNARLHQRIYKKNNFPLYRFSAGIAAMIVVSVLFFTLTNRKLDDMPAQKSVAENKVEAPLKDSIARDKAAKIAALEEEKELSEQAQRAEKKREKGKVAEEIFDDEVEVVQEESSMAILEMQAEEPGQLMETVPSQTSSPKVKPIQESENLGFVVTEDKNLNGEKSKKRNRLSLPKEAKREIEYIPGMIPANSVQGKVVASDDSLPLPGVTVLVKGTDKGAVTNIDGLFVIPLEKADSSITLTASYIGMENEEMQVTAGRSADIVMNPDIASLDEVVVIAYGNKTDTYSTSYAEPTPIPDYKSFNKYIESHIQFPESVEGISRAVVVFKFVVGTNGKPKEFDIIRSPDEAFSKEAKRLILEGPDWKPSEIDGNAVEEYVRLRIIFKK